MRAPALLLAFVLGAGSAWAQRADPASDAPEERFTSSAPVPEIASYAEALARWRRPEDLNAWIGAHFRYDLARALQLSETQRARGGRIAIHAPQDFFAAPSGVCVDLARFAVETLREVAPELRPRYLMIEFDPVTLQGQTLRRHWVAVFEREGQHYVLADSKRPGHLAGPYASVEAFIRDYAAYRGRNIAAWRETDTYARRVRARAQQAGREVAR